MLKKLYTEKNKVVEYGMDARSQSVKLQTQNLWHFISTRNNILNTNLRTFEKNCSVQRQKAIVPKIYPVASDEFNWESKTNRKQLNRSDGPSKKTACVSIPFTFVRPDQRSNTWWKMPPNRYDISKVPFASRRGKKGAYIEKLRKRKRRNLNKIINEHISGKGRRSEMMPTNMMCTSTESFKPLYKRISALIADMDIEAPKPKRASTFLTQLKDLDCPGCRGTFLKAKRFGRSTSRLMATSLVDCYKDPNEPGPADYTISYMKRDFGKTRKRKTDQFKFYANSCVPVKEEYIKKDPNTNPGPGRYETRFIKLCPCKRGLTYEPDLDLLLERENRLEFREIPYTPIKRHIYESPNWSHVKGHGFRYLYQITSTSKGKKPKEEQFNSYVKKEMYLRMINHPKRIPLSIRHPYMTKVNIHFTRIVKATRRRALRVFTNVAFGKCFGGFFAQNPDVRPVKDLPVMTKDIEEITTKYDEVPERLRPSTVHPFHRNSFAFLSMPGEKLLVDTEKEIHDGAQYGETLGYYHEQIQFENFLDISIPESTKHLLGELDNLDKKQTMRISDDDNLRAFSTDVTEYE